MMKWYDPIVISWVVALHGVPFLAFHLLVGQHEGYLAWNRPAVIIYNGSLGGPSHLECTTAWISPVTQAFKNSMNLLDWICQSVICWQDTEMSETTDTQTQTQGDLLNQQKLLRSTELRHRRPAAGPRSD